MDAGRHATLEPGTRIRRFYINLLILAQAIRTSTHLILLLSAPGILTLPFLASEPGGHSSENG